MFNNNYGSTAAMNFSFSKKNTREQVVINSIIQRFSIYNQIKSIHLESARINVTLHDYSTRGDYICGIDPLTSTWLGFIAYGLTCCCCKPCVIPHNQRKIESLTKTQGSLQKKLSDLKSKVDAVKADEGAVISKVVISYLDF